MEEKRKESKGFDPDMHGSAASTDESQAAWEAYRNDLVAYARLDAAGCAPSDPRAAVPDPLRPGSHRVHHSYIWLGGFSDVGAVALAIALAAAGSFPSLLDEMPPVMALAAAGGIALAAIAALAVLFLAGKWIAWRRLGYELTPAELTVFSGVVNKRRHHVPYGRVQSVNQQAGVLQRIVGICNVKIDTAGGAANEAVVLRYMRTSDAEALRAELFRRKKVLAAGGMLDEFGNAFIGGSVAPSAWMTACAGGNYAAVQRAFGGKQAQEGVRAATAQIGGACQVGGNVLDAADEILADVRGVFGGAEVATGAVSYEAGLTNKELLFAGLSGAAGRFGVIVAGIVGLAVSAAQFFSNNIDFWIESALEGSQAAVDAAGGDAAAALSAAFASLAWQVALWAILSVAALWLFSVVGTAVQYGGFRVRRRENRVEVEHGLLQRTFHGVDVDRVQTLVVKQSFVRRLMGYCELSVGKVDATASDGQEGADQARGMVIHPFVKTSRVPELVEGLLPEFADMPARTAAPAPVALRRAVVRNTILRSFMFWTTLAWSVVVAACEFIARADVSFADQVPLSLLEMGWAACAAVFVIAFALNAVDAVLWHRESFLGYDDRFMIVVNGGLSSTTSVFPRRKIQFAYLKTNPFQRRAGVAIVNARTASGVGGTTEQLWDLASADAEAWMDWARPRGRALRCEETPGRVASPEDVSA